jgi:hypothetical protein
VVGGTVTWLRLTRLDGSAGRVAWSVGGRWWLALGTADLDHARPGAPPATAAACSALCAGSIRTLREELLHHLPEEQPALSLRLAGVDEEEAQCTVQRVALMQQAVRIPVDFRELL